jgi:hypothetical protein
MLQLALSLHGLTSKSVQFVTSPNVPWPSNQNDVEFQQPQAHQLFEAIAHDTMPMMAKNPAKGAKPAATPATPPATTSPSEVSVDVLNGTRVAHLAAQTAGSLTSRGFHVVGTGDASNAAHTKSVIEYASAADLPAANTLRAQIGHAKVVQDPALTPGSLTLIVGSSFTGLSSSPSPSPSPSPSAGASPPSVSSVAASDQGITADTSICKDQAAFAGPGG